MNRTKVTHIENEQEIHAFFVHEGKWKKFYAWKTMKRKGRKISSEQHFILMSPWKNDYNAKLIMTLMKVIFGGWRRLRVPLQTRRHFPHSGALVFVFVLSLVHDFIIKISLIESQNQCIPHN